MLQNAYFLAKIGADTAGNEQHFGEILPTDAWGTGDHDGLRDEPAGRDDEPEMRPAQIQRTDAFTVDLALEVAVLSGLRALEKAA